MTYTARACAALLVCAAARGQVAADEAATRAKLTGGVTSVSFAVNNRLNTAVDARVELEWLEPDGRRTHGEAALHKAPPGRSTLDLRLPLSGPLDPLQLRLHYRILPGPANLTAFQPNEGILAFPYIAEHAFRLTGFGVGVPKEGQPWEVRVIAMHPVTAKPLHGVQLTVGKSKGSTGADGMAAFRLEPERGGEDGGSVGVEGVLGDVEQEIELRRPEASAPVIRIDTDKPIYEPGQTLHIRALVTGGKRKAGDEYSIVVNDKDGTEVHEATKKLSKFGVIHTDWRIPGNATPGNYEIEVEHEESGRSAKHSVQVKRYELPSFRVIARLDRDYYLPGQQPAVEVRAEYLFGKPVSKGTARVTLGDGKESVREGALEGGVFRLTLDVADEFEKVDRYERFRDLHYTAFVTDASTNRTEQKRFDVRVSRDPVHLYVFTNRSGLYLAPYFVTASTPDGKPISCDIELLHEGKRVTAGRTNRLGVARLEAPAAIGDLMVRAATPTGVSEQRADSPDLRGLRIDTDKSLYRVGEPVVCTLVSAARDLPLSVFAWNDAGQVVFSKTLRLDRTARITIPFDPRAGRELRIGAVSRQAFESQATRTVLYPGPASFRVDVQPGRGAYRPGDKGSLSFRAVAAGAPVEAALGIAIVDQSVFERATTDEAFGRRQWFGSWRPSERQIGGITRDDLIEMDPAKIDADAQLLAEALVDPGFAFDVPYDDSLDAFVKPAADALSGIKNRLDSHHHETLEFPRDEMSFHRILGGATLPGDPWRQPYRLEFETRRDRRVVRFVSAGPDKRAGTADDFEALEIGRPWFLPYEALIREALRDLDDSPRTEADFARIVAEGGIRWEALRDPWGNPLRARTWHRWIHRTVEVQSAGPDGRWDTNDDFRVASFEGTYFQRTQRRIEHILGDARDFPRDAARFREVLFAGGVNLEAMRDPWGNPYYVIARSEWEYGNYVHLSTYSRYNGVPEQRQETKPGKTLMAYADVRSSGPDGVRGTYDDFPVASFSRATDEVREPPAAPASSRPGPLPGTGSIGGVVKDATGAVIPNTVVMLDGRHRTVSNEGGEYEFLGVPSGTYALRFECPGFRVHTVGEVPVTPGRATRVNVTLEVGAVTETIQVAASPAIMQTEMAVASSSAQVIRTGTPRLREYFPETLLWQPELITDSRGAASLDLRLADSITTWRVAVIASTADGRVTEASSDLRVFQPFFAELDPPRVLTVGDRVDLPVPIRNYLETAQSIAIEAVAPRAISLPNGARSNLRVPASDSANAVLRLNASAADPAAPLRVVARGNAASDAIEKKIEIHPDGDRVTRSVNDLVDSARSLRIDVPANIVAGSARGEVKLYPSLLAHLVESMESMLRIPAGCGEQTVSSTYPSVHYLRVLEVSGVTNENGRERALAYLEAGYRRLLGFRAGSGGFRYWPRDSEAHVALTAHAVKFLDDAAKFIEVDGDVTKKAREWLASQQDNDESTQGLALRALAGASNAAVLDRLGALARRAANTGDPYAMASFVLAAVEADRHELARPAVERLRELAQDRQGAAFWHLRVNTPFHGWGDAGRIETTALVVEALAKWRKKAGEDRELKALTDRGVLFLLRRKHGGLWLSTQATVRVFEAMLAVLATGTRPSAWTAEISVNGRVAGRVQVPAGDAVRAPVTLDVSRFLRPGTANEISISGAPRDAAAQVQFGAEWYEPWNGPKTSNDFSYSVQCEKTEASVNDRIRCDVTVTRTAFQGYGMMIAEAGLPPGAEVDRGALEDLRGVSSSEVWPDRVIFYVWPNRPETKFSFWMRPRYPVEARSAPSTLYDYYNPDARVTLPPALFRVR